LRSSLNTPGHPGRTSASIRGRALAGVVAASAVAMTTLALPGASAAPKPTPAQVQRTVDRLQEEAEQAAEQYNETREELKSISVRLRAATAKSSHQSVEVAKAKVQIGRLAAETYRQGELSALDLMLGDDPEAYLAQAGYLPTLAERQNDAMNRLANGERMLAAAQADIAAQRKRAQAANARISRSRVTVQRKLAQARAQLNLLGGSQRSALRNGQLARVSAGVPDGGSASMCRSKAAKAPNRDARTALTFACNQIGDPYKWAADGPGSWDCSGLTMKAWAAAGVSLPHSSKLQADYGTKVSNSQLQAGDLVFFHSPISHVGLYLGDGLMVHAPQTGDVVRVVALNRTPTAAVRL
jgi:peptidoglycan DL-endopeptidase CwlO